MKFNIYIQQLRGIAILFIILYHYFRTNRINGYLSVTIFLQISGYVTAYSSINRKFNISFFFYKRIINIFPQLYITIIFLLFINRNYSFNRINNLYDEILSVIKINSNIYFYKKEIDYFNQFENPSFTLHFWYISLQQQLYILFPILSYSFIYIFRI